MNSKIRKNIEKLVQKYSRYYRSTESADDEWVFMFGRTKVIIWTYQNATTHEIKVEVTPRGDIMARYRVAMNIRSPYMLLLNTILIDCI